MIVHGIVRDDTKRGGGRRKAMHRHPVSPMGVLLVFLLACSKSKKMTILVVTCSKLAK